MDTSGYIVADGADGFHIEASRVGQVPVEVALARVDGAGIAASHRDDNVGCRDLFSDQALRDLPRNVEPQLGHRLDYGGVELACRLRSCRRNPNATASLMAEQRCGHL